MNLTRKLAESPHKSKTWEKQCNRCSVTVSPRGGMRATITGDDGRARVKFICAECCRELDGALAALCRNAAAHEQHLAAERERTGRSLERAA